MAKVTIRGREGATQLLRRFKRQCEADGVMREIKRKTCFEKPSDKRRRARRERLREAQKHSTGEQGSTQKRSYACDV